MTVKRSVEEYSFDTVAVCAKILIKEMTEMEEKETVTQRERLEQTMDAIRRRYGSGAITYGEALSLREEEE